MADVLSIPMQQVAPETATNGRFQGFIKRLASLSSRVGRTLSAGPPAHTLYFRCCQPSSSHLTA